MKLPRSLKAGENHVENVKCSLSSVSASYLGYIAKTTDRSDRMMDMFFDSAIKDVPFDITLFQKQIHHIKKRNFYNMLTSLKRKLLSRF